MVDRYSDVEDTPRSVFVALLAILAFGCGSHIQCKFKFSAKESSEKMKGKVLLLPQDGLHKYSIIRLAVIRDTRISV